MEGACELEEIREALATIVSYCKDRKDRNSTCFGCPIRKDYGDRQPDGCYLYKINRPSDLSKLF